jgi:hypothetical protein
MLENLINSCLSTLRIAVAALMSIVLVWLGRYIEITPEMEISLTQLVEGLVFVGVYGLMRLIEGWTGWNLFLFKKPGDIK